MFFIACKSSPESQLLPPKILGNHVVLSIKSFNYFIAQWEEISEGFGEEHPILQINYSEIPKYDVGTLFYLRFPEGKSEKPHISIFGELIDSVKQVEDVTDVLLIKLFFVKMKMQSKAHSLPLCSRKRALGGGLGHMTNGLVRMF